MVFGFCYNLVASPYEKKLEPDGSLSELLVNVAGMHFEPLGLRVVGEDARQQRLVDCDDWLCTFRVGQKYSLDDEGGKDDGDAHVEQSYADVAQHGCDRGGDVNTQLATAH